jgi:osmotically-inducible protein OsmY
MFMSKSVAKSLIIALAFSAGSAIAATSVTSDEAAANANVQDQMHGTQADLALTQQIRRLLTNDKTLSIKAQNVKIVTVKGVATLRGNVDSTDESSKIESLARQVAGVNSVQNYLEITQ